MVAWLTRLFLLVQLAAGVGIHFALLDRFEGLPASCAALLAALAVVLLRGLIVLNNFRLAARHRSALPAHCQLDFRQRLRLFFGELRATLTASSWHMPFRRFHKRPGSATASLPVLLIHGYGCNSGYWQPLSQALMAANITHHALDLEPVFGSIDDYVAPIHAAVEELCRDSGQPRVAIVAHSMGGLAARAYLRDHGSARITKIVTLGTPHHGTALAQFGIGLNTREMHWTPQAEGGIASDWLQKLEQAENPEVYRLFVSIYSHHDNIVFPQSSSLLPGARNIALHGIGHVALAPAPEVQALVLSELAVPEAGQSA